MPLVLGAAYAPVTRNLVPLTVALFMLCVGSAGRLVSLTVDRPGVAAVAAALEISSFWIVGLFATMKWDSFGAAMAALLGSTVYAAVISWPMCRELPYSRSTAAWTGALAVLFVPLVWLKGEWPTNALLFVVASTGYLLCLFRMRIVTFAEIAKAGQLLRPGRPVSTTAA